jgi:adenylate kinase family enzyme
MKRIIVVGSTGSGKTTLAGQLGARLGYPHVELDALHWEPNWQEAHPDIFRDRVSRALDQDLWVVDGNYSKVRDLVWPEADTLIWLDYSLWINLWRVISRTAKRVATRELLWGNNRESLNALLGRDSLVVWLFQTYGRRRKELPILLQQPEHAHLNVIRLHSPAETRRWLGHLTNSTDQE